MDNVKSQLTKLEKLFEKENEQLIKIEEKQKQINKSNEKRAEELKVYLKIVEKEDIKNNINKELADIYTVLFTNIKTPVKEN